MYYIVSKIFAPAPITREFNVGIVGKGSDEKWGLKVIEEFAGGLLCVSTACEDDTNEYIGVDQLLDDGELEGNQFVIDGFRLFSIMEKAKDVVLADIGLAYYNGRRRGVDVILNSWLMVVDQKPVAIDVWIEVVRELFIHSWDNVLLVTAKASDYCVVKPIGLDDVNLISLCAEHIKANFKQWVEKTSADAYESDGCAVERHVLPFEAHSILLPKEGVDEVLAQRSKEKMEKEENKRRRADSRREYARSHSEKIIGENKEMGLSEFEDVLVNPEDF